MQQQHQQKDETRRRRTTIRKVKDIINGRKYKEYARTSS